MTTKTGKILAFGLAFALAGAANAFSQLDITGRPPVFGGDATLSDALNTALNDQFTNAINEIMGEIGNLNPVPQDFIRSWGNASVFGSHGASQRGFGGYNRFAVSFGAMVGLQLPAGIGDLADDLDNITNTLNTDGDIALGVSPHLFVAQVGINTSRFLRENLYLGLRVGFFNGDAIIPIDGFSFNSFTIGALANYQIIPRVNLAGRFVQWGGVNLGSGLIFSRTAISYGLALERVNQDLGAVGGIANPILHIDPTLYLDMRINTVTIPIEVMTSAQILFLNFALGLGADLAFGRSDINIGMDGDISVSGLGAANVHQVQNGYLSLNAGGAFSPRFINLKMMTGIGFVLGPVFIDIPLTMYVNHGFNVGLTLGFRL
ncbi:MAG: hypothetical protein FWG66_08580 [Spirochaetes bacterium]|nr:hypothetical protein [Spirochaetota bacterium]